MTTKPHTSVEGKGVFSTVDRAALSGGSSNDAIYSLVARSLHGEKFARVVDIGCGSAAIAGWLRPQIETYVGCDVIKYDGFPTEPWTQFRNVDLEKLPYAVESASADLVLCIEVIEHVENPRALMRELVRIAKPGGRVVVTTPNQLSIASKLCLFARNEFQAFQESAGLYPAHITALLEVDLRHIAREAGLTHISVYYSDSGRIPFSARLWPKPLRGRAFSDNVLLTATR